MNDKNLYRGKRVDNDEWVEGDLIHRQIWRRTLAIIRVSDDGFEHYEEYEVIPESVGQFTGLTDKNGKKIFEGNILKIISSVKGGIIDDTRAFESVKREDYAVVLWDCKTGGYKLKVYHKGKYKRISKFAVGHLFVYNAEVIGNIYDNPELLLMEIEIE